MKCDELKSLVFSLKDLAYIDETYVKNNFGNPHDHAVYKATEVDEAIAELKEAIQIKDDLLIEDGKEIGRQKVEINEAVKTMKSLEAEIIELKAKLENVQASMYCDVVDANMEVRKLKHSLYNLRACYADMMQKRYIECKFDGWVHRVNKWIEVERKCLKKAEEYR